MKGRSCSDAPPAGGTRMPTRAWSRQEHRGQHSNADEPAVELAQDKASRPRPAKGLR